VVESVLESFPWPIQLGLVGFFAVAWITTITLHNRTLNSGKLVPSERVDKQLAQKDTVYKEMVAAKNTQYDNMVTAKDLQYQQMVDEKDKQLQASLEVKNEWKKAHEVSEQARAEERLTTAQAVEGSRAIEHFLVSVVPKVVPKTPITGDNDSGGGPQ
jgi:hypothetical protein